MIKIFLRGMTRIITPRQPRRPLDKRIAKYERIGDSSDDAKALAGDWRAVGDDIRNAMRRFEEEVGDE